MATPPPYTPVLRRDGSSQRARTPAALDPGTVSIDERSAADLLRFVREYAKELVYYGDDDEPAGDWSGLLGASEDLEALAASTRTDRPHLALLLAFIELLGRAQGQMNALTGRHLEFYYRTVLGMTTRPALPDRVNVLMEPSAGVERVRVPAGTRLDAGKDDEGAARVYRTDRDLVVGHAEVAEVRSVFIERNAVTPRDAREQHEGTADEAFLAMLRVALGDPRPGDPLPAYKGTEAVDVALLRQLRVIADFAPQSLFMALSELRSLMRLVARRAGADADWDEINGLLQEAARNRLGDPAHVLEVTDPRDFDANLQLALGGQPDFSGLAEVSTIDDVYYQRVRPDVAAFILEQLCFSTVADFVRMMQLELRSDHEWREINRILESSGREKRDDLGYSLDPADPTDFPANFEAALGPVDWSGLSNIDDLDAYVLEIEQIDGHFHMPAEDLAHGVSVHDDPQATDADWSVVHELLDDAHAEKVYAGRRAALVAARSGAPTDEDALVATFSAGLGQEPGPAGSLQLYSALRELVASPLDQAFLRDVAYRVTTNAGSITAEEWTEIDRVVELAQRTREQLPRPVPRIVEWQGIHPYLDAREVTATLGLEADREIPRWKTFGEAQVHDDPLHPPPAVLGWGLRSSLLALREGERTITLTLGFTAAGFDGARIDDVLTAEPFAVEVTTDEGWVELPLVTVTSGDYGALAEVARTIDPALPALRIQASLPPDAAPLTAKGDVPALRLMLRPVWDPGRGRFLTHYAPFKELQLQAVHLKVEAAGITSLSLQSDEGDLDPTKPFTPFGRRPAVGSRLRISHPELTHKRLDEVRFHLDWMRVPSDLAAHYANYGITPEFQVRVALHDRQRDVTAKPAAALFDPTDARAPHPIDIVDLPAALHAADPTHDYQRAPLRAGSRHLLWELTPVDFQHDAYPQVATAKANEMSAAIAAQVASGSSTPVDVSAYQVNPPYTPTLERLAVDYVASTELLVGVEVEVESAASGSDVAYHVHPFGTCELVPGPGGAPLLPDYDRYEGELYIGIRGLEPPQNLSMLLQLAEGSADPDLEPAAVEWSMLHGDRWVPLHDGSLRADGTVGLLGSGIVELSLSPCEPSTMLPVGLHWLRAAVTERTASVCDTIAVHAQAVSATFVDDGHAPSHYDAPLPAGTITRLLSPIRGVAAVHQPYTGYGGAAPERDAQLNARVSERLRHKQRALTRWDYEHLVLQRFPRIYKAKCLPARLDEQALPYQDRPGKVVVIVIPDIRGQIPFDPFEPKAPASTIAAIEAWLADKVPGPATVEVRNAHYVEVQVQVSVRFLPGEDQGYARQTLNEEINRFLSPWAYDDGVDITIGDRIYANSLIDFVDRRPYVDYVYGLTLHRRAEGERVFVEVLPSPTEGYYVAAGRPDGVLVAARSHQIEVGTDRQLSPQAAIGVNHMTIGLDFIVTKALGGVGVMGIEVDFVVGEPGVTKVGIGSMVVNSSFRVG